MKEFNHKNILVYSLILFISLSFILTPGCLGIPGLPGSEQTTGIQEPTPIPEQEDNAESLSPEPEFILWTPEPTKTPIISTVADWNPYETLPLPQSIKNRTSILKNNTSNVRQHLNVTYTGSTGLGGYAVGKVLNITKGPFAISYTVHPNVTNPILVWAKLTIRDPWEQIIAEDGYNRGYSSEETKTITVYREGIHYLTLEGEFATMDYILKTGDPAPEITPTPVPEYYEEEWPEGEEPF